MEHKPTPSQGPHAGLPQPFTLEDLRQDILEIYLLQLRAMCLLSSDKNVWALAGKSGIPDGSLWDGRQQADDYGLTYADVAGSNFATALEQQFSFAFTGLDTHLCEPMEPETMHAWVAAYLTDLRSSAFASEWGTYGGDVNVSRCLHTCELANARVVLEGGENFFPFMSDKDDERNKADGALTVRQMALLADMEEMTIRTAISRKGPNQLKAFKDERRTLIRPDDAKAWLTSKGRYVPVSHQSLAGSALDLSRTGFTSAIGIAHALTRRFNYVNELDPSANCQSRLDKLARRLGLNRLNFDDTAVLLNADAMRELGDLLQLPPELLILRAKEAVLHEELAGAAAALQDSIAKYKAEQH